MGILALDVKKRASSYKSHRSRVSAVSLELVLSNRFCLSCVAVQTNVFASSGAVTLARHIFLGVFPQSGPDVFLLLYLPSSDRCSMR